MKFTTRLQNLVQQILEAKMRIDKKIMATNFSFGKRDMSEIAPVSRSDRYDISVKIYAKCTLQFINVS